VLVIKQLAASIDFYSSSKNIISQCGPSTDWLLTYFKIYSFVFKGT